MCYTASEDPIERIYPHRQNSTQRKFEVEKATNRGSIRVPFHLLGPVPSDRFPVLLGRPVVGKSPFLNLILQDTNTCCVFYPNAPSAAPSPGLSERQTGWLGGCGTEGVGSACACGGGDSGSEVRVRVRACVRVRVCVCARARVRMRVCASVCAPVCATVCVFLAGRPLPVGARVPGPGPLPSTRTLCPDHGRVQLGSWDRKRPRRRLGSANAELRKCMPSVARAGGRGLPVRLPLWLAVAPRSRSHWQWRQLEGNCAAAAPPNAEWPPP
jgi:hypothetical protein